jgi:hypothetical protein
MNNFKLNPEAAKMSLLKRRFYLMLHMSVFLIKLPFYVFAECVKTFYDILSDIPPELKKVCALFKFVWEGETK